MLAISAENLTRLRNGITMAIGRRQNRRAIYQFLRAELRALHCSYGIGSEVSYTKAIAFLECCQEFTLRSMVAEQAIKVFIDAVRLLAEDQLIERYGIDAKLSPDTSR
jgi:hypothetical protein